MDRYDGRVRFVLSAVAIGSLILGSSVAALADDQGSQSSPTDKEVQERAVPRTGTIPGVAVPKAPPKGEGAVVQGNQLKALPGYVLQPGPNNTVSARRAGGGGGLGLSVECICDGGTGNCSIGTSGPIATCTVQPNGPCNGTCKWGDANVVGGMGGGMMRQ